MKILTPREEFPFLKNITCECYECNKPFLREKRWILHEELHKVGRNRFCSRECVNSYKKKYTLIACKNCGKEISSMYKFCGSACAATFNNKQRLKKDRTKTCVICNNKFETYSIKKNTCSKQCSKNLLILNKQDIDNRLNKILPLLELKCKVCGNIFKHRNYRRTTCSKECLSSTLKIGGKRGGMLATKVKRSKNEILFAELCQQHFKNVLVNEKIFDGWDADVILPDLKIAILWNGIWHYEQLSFGNHSLKQVQTRDKIKIQAIEKQNYIPYIIKDLKKSNINFVRKEFEKLIKYIAQ